MHFDCTKRDRGLVLETTYSSDKGSKQWKKLPRDVEEYPSLLVSKNECDRSKLRLILV